MIKFFSIVLIICIFYGCSSRIGEKKLKEGVIKYDITYFEDEKDNPVIGLLPTTLELSFKKGKTSGKIEGWMGVFSAKFISNTKTGINYTLIKILNKKYKHTSTIADSSSAFNLLSNIEISISGEKSDILGYKCQKATVNHNKNKEVTFDIYYTDQIKIEKPVWLNAYKIVDGVLLEFEIEFSQIRMKLKASEITGKKINDPNLKYLKDIRKLQKKT